MPVDELGHFLVHALLFHHEVLHHVVKGLAGEGMLHSRPIAEEQRIRDDDDAPEAEFRTCDHACLRQLGRVGAA